MCADSPAEPRNSLDQPWRGRPVKHSAVSATRRPDVPARGGSVADLAAPIAPRRHRGTSSTASSVERRVLTELDPARARSLLGLADVPTIAAIGPFDDRTD